jgi:peptidoglycan/xylan/chitin deacetylase (PgdA/CDA1 family)
MHRFAIPDLGVAGHDPALLAAQLEYLRRHRYRLMSLGELLHALEERIPIRENAVVFTVDDGYADFAEVAAPVFAAYDCPVTVFLVTDFVSGRLWNWFDHVEWSFAQSERREVAIDIHGGRIRLRWTNPDERLRASSDVVERLKRLKDPVRRRVIGDLAAALEVEVPELAPVAYRALTWTQVGKCAESGVTFGPHTVTHPILTQLDDAEAAHEISASWRAVKDATTAAVPIFCYPNGTPLDFSEREKTSVMRAGMTAALSTIGGSLQALASGVEATDRLALPRFPYPAGTPALVQIVSGLEERKSRIRRWLK